MTRDGYGIGSYYGATLTDGAGIGDSHGADLGTQFPTHPHIAYNYDHYRLDGIGYHYYINYSDNGDGSGLGDTYGEVCTDGSGESVDEVRDIE